LRSVFGKLDPEEEPARYTAFVSRVLEQALREERDPSVRLEIANRVIELISGFQDHEHRLLGRLHRIREYVRRGNDQRAGVEPQSHRPGHALILERFVAEFDTYWHSREFQDYDPAAPERFREAISRERNRTDPAAAPFFDLTPHPFQERILEALAAERSAHGHWRNLVIAATGTGKTVVAAFEDVRLDSPEDRGRRRKSLCRSGSHSRRWENRTMSRAILTSIPFSSPLKNVYCPPLGKLMTLLR
jgi:hypothetical protein